MATGTAESKATPKLRTVKVRLPTGSRRTEKDVWNVSLGGVFVEMVDPPSFGSELGLEFVMARETDNIVCEGFVVWSTTTSPDKAPGKTGAAVRLVNIGIREMRLLAEAIGRELEGVR